VKSEGEALFLSINERKWDFISLTNVSNPVPYYIIWLIYVGSCSRVLVVIGCFSVYNSYTFGCR
jgi:hypothetical protein